MCIFFFTWPCFYSPWEQRKNSPNLNPICFVISVSYRNTITVSAETEPETERTFLVSAKPNFGQNGRNSAESRNRICFGRTLLSRYLLRDLYTCPRTDWLHLILCSSNFHVENILRVHRKCRFVLYLKMLFILCIVQGFWAICELFLQNMYYSLSILDSLIITIFPNHSSQ